MGKKDKEKSDTFNNPFSQLKGLSVLSRESVPVAKNETAAVVCPEPPVESVDEDDQFAQAMGQLGVQQGDRGDSLDRSKPVQLEGEVTTESVRHAGSEPLQGGSRRQVRKIARRLGEPEATLDLHGVAAADVVRKVEWFVENALFHGCHVVRIVTGKGAHSETGPVLRPLVEEYLSGAGQKHVIAWVRAPRSQGGEGALLAELRRPDDVG